MFDLNSVVRTRCRLSEMNADAKRNQHLGERETETAINTARRSRPQSRQRCLCLFLFLVVGFFQISSFSSASPLDLDVRLEQRFGTPLSTALSSPQPAARDAIFLCIWDAFFCLDCRHLDAEFQSDSVDFENGSSAEVNFPRWGVGPRLAGCDWPRRSNNLDWQCQAGVASNVQY